MNSSPALQEIQSLGKSSPNTGDWRHAFELVLGEHDPERLKENVFSLEEAVYRRFQVLHKSQDAAAERNELHQAMATLLKIKTERLQYPPVTFDS